MKLTKFCTFLIFVKKIVEKFGSFLTRATILQAALQKLQEAEQRLRDAESREMQWKQK